MDLNSSHRPKTRTQRLAEVLLRDRAERTARKATRAGNVVKIERAEFDPFGPARWRVIAGDDPGYLPKTEMRRTEGGWSVKCPDCDERFKSTGTKHRSCNPRPKRMGQQCEGPGCERCLSRYARANTRFCSDRCRKAAKRALSVAADLSAKLPPETPGKRALLIGPQDMPINVVGGYQPRPGRARTLMERTR
jgi:hypothetical protein